MDRTPDQIHGLAQQAEQLLGSEPFQGFVKSAEDRITDQWKLTTPGSDGIVRREELHAQLSGLAVLVTELAIAISDRDVLTFQDGKQKNVSLAGTSRE